MSVPIINTLGEMTSFNQYAQTQSYVYGSVAEALDSGRYLEPVTTPNTIDATGARFQVLEYQPELTGGTKVGTGIVDFIKGEGRCEPFVYGGAIALSGIEILGGILAGLGLSIASYELNKDMWIDISNNAFQNFPGYVPVTYDNIEEMSIIGFFANNTTYIPYEIVQAVANYLLSIDAYGHTEVSYDVPTVADYYDVYSAEVNSGTISGLFTSLLEKVSGMYHQSASLAFSKALEHAKVQIESGLYNSCSIQLISSGDISSNSGAVDIYLFNDSLPIHKYINQFTATSAYLNSKTSSYRVHGSCSIEEGRPTSINAYTATNMSTSRYIGILQSGLQLETSSFNATIEIVPYSPALVPLPDSIPVEAPNNIPLEYPDWWANRATINNPATETPYLPVGVPGASPKTVPVTTPQPVIQTGVVPETNPKPVEDGPIGMPTPKGVVPEPTYPKEPTPTPTPTPSIPVIPAIGGQANALFTVYNPSQANLNSLGAVLWSQNIIEQIVQMFTNNPMDAIISLHILYATPTTGANKEIKLGYLPTGVSCPEVTNQYVNINCGTVRIPELFGDVRDYANTDITIYLPMIGFRQLKTEDAMASNITVDYKVDVFTGTVLANVTVTRDSINKVFYTFEGNCAVNLPLTGADKSRQLATAVGVIGSVVTGNPMAGLASATAIAGGSARAQIQRSGNFTGNAGAMGCKKPYIIVSSDIPYDAAGYNTQYGFPANLTVMLGTCHGYVKAKEVHADTIANATEQEKRDIENQLKQGIIIH